MKRTNVGGVDLTMTGEARGVTCGAYHAPKARRTLREALAAPAASADGSPWWVCSACGRRYLTSEVRQAQTGKGIVWAGIVDRLPFDPETPPLPFAGPDLATVNAWKAFGHALNAGAVEVPADGSSYWYRGNAAAGFCRVRPAALPWSASVARVVTAARRLRRFPWFVLGDDECPPLARRSGSRRVLASRGLVTWPCVLGGVVEIATEHGACSGFGDEFETMKGGR